MEKQEWQNLYNVLDKILDDFQSAYFDSKNGKNEKIRSAGKKNVDRAIRLADYHITNNYNAYELLTGKNGSDISRAFLYDEFKQPHYFGRDLASLLDKIKIEMGEL
ncbi:MAG: hypothetical protein CMP48_27565 [Rickettsiales bacterium]|nr:hypothetical protein [Rickettsiales bacterium]